MSEANEGMTETQTDEGQTQNEEGSEESYSQEQTTDDKYTALQTQMSQLANVVQGFSGQFGQIQEALKPKQRQLSVEEKNTLLQQNPLAAIESVVSEKINGQTDVIRREMDKKHWDSKVESDFPIKDPLFMDELKKQWSSLVEAGIDANNPKAVYKAAEAAALVRGVKKQQATQTKTYMSGESGSETRMSKPKSSISDNDPRVRIYQLMGVNAKQVEQFKKDLEVKDNKGRRR